MPKTKSFLNEKRSNLNVRPDTLDFRDRMFQPTLVEVPSKIDLDDYLKCHVPILDQGKEGACTGYGLATIIHYLLRTRKVVPDVKAVSPHMLYQLAKKFDEWAGEKYEGSSPRGAMKGWHKHGVCSNDIWRKEKRFSAQVYGDAISRPLGAYLRVNHKDLIAMHSAIAEVGILYASANVHIGWDDVKNDGSIPLKSEILGGHAFAIVAYDESGFWIQNSWGNDWGKRGFARISYDDWLTNGIDVWVARLGAPVKITSASATAVRHSSATTYTDAQSHYEMRQHIVSIGNDGLLKENGVYGTTEEDVKMIFTKHFSDVSQGWAKKRILLYAHGGLVGENTAVQKLADYRPTFLKEGVYPIFFIWHSDAWTTLTNILKEAVGSRKTEGLLDSAKDFMLDRLDDALEPLARGLTGKAQWDEMKENAVGATKNKKGGAVITAKYLKDLLAADKSIEIHIVGHSAGSIFHAPLITHLNDLNIKIKTCTLWAPACTVDLFKKNYMPAIKNNRIESFTLFTLSDKAEQDDNCGNIYNKSLLYLVSNAFEEKPRIPVFRDGEPILGMEKFVSKDAELRNLFKSGRADWIVSPNNNSGTPINYATAEHHGDFDDDKATVAATVARILDKGSTNTINFSHSASSLRARRLKLA